MKPSKTSKVGSPSNVCLPDWSHCSKDSKYLHLKAVYLHLGLDEPSSTLCIVHSEVGGKHTASYITLGLFPVLLFLNGITWGNNYPTIFPSTNIIQF